MQENQLNTLLEMTRSIQDKVDLLLTRTDLHARQDAWIHYRRGIELSEIFDSPDYEEWYESFTKLTGHSLPLGQYKDHINKSRSDLLRKIAKDMLILWEQRYSLGKMIDHGISRLMNHWPDWDKKHEEFVEWSCILLVNALLDAKQLNACYPKQVRTFQDIFDYTVTRESEPDKAFVMKRLCVNKLK